MYSQNETVYEGYPYGFALPFELNHNKYYHRVWMQRNWHSCLYIIGLYLLVVAYLHRFMRNRAPYQLKKTVFLWDVTLAAFSTFGMCRTIPEIIHVLQNYGIEFSVCNSNCNSVTAFWGYAFAMSKAPELLDTVLIVLKKQKLTPLHLIHHVMTLLVTWYSYMDHPSLSRWVFGMNYSIHAFMYTYYAIKATKVHVPNFVSMTITLAQISQMVLGLFASLFCAYVILSGKDCSTSISVAVSGIFTYVSFLYLFVSFFIHRYQITMGSKVKKLS